MSRLTYQAMEQEEKPKKTMRFLPPEEFEFGTMLFREFLHRLEKLGYVNKSTKAVHVAIFRRYTRRLIDCLDSKEEIAWDAFGSKDKLWLSWADVRHGVVNGAVVPIRTRFSERVMLTMEDPSSCWLAVIWMGIIFVAIVASVGLVVVQSMPGSEWCPSSDSPTRGPVNRCHSELEVVCVLIFSIDYFVKLLCVPRCRNAIFERDWHLETAVPAVDPFRRTSKGNDVVKMTELQRLRHFVFRPLNMIDFVAILPFWLQLLVADLIPFPLAFLRGLRLLRFLRVMKFGRFNSTLTVLGTTLTRSTQAVYVLILYIALTSLVAGAIFNQAEPSIECFENVPKATWWVFTRMVAMQHSAGIYKTCLPVTPVSQTLTAFLLILKGIIWILPFGQIGGTFREAWADNEAMQKLRQEVEIEDNRNPDRVWIEDGEAAMANIEVWEDDGHDMATVALSGNGVLAGFGSIPVPILEKTPSSAVVTTKLWGGEMKSWCAFPTVDFHIFWKPSEVSNGSSQGTLLIKPIAGSNFSGTGSSTWRCAVRAPSQLYGPHAGERWWSSPSTGGAPIPSWADSPAANFEIRWEEAGSKPASSNSAAAGHSDSEALQKVLRLLEEQNRKLDDLSRRSAAMEEDQSKKLEELSKRAAAVEEAIAKQTDSIDSSKGPRKR